MQRIRFAALGAALVLGIATAQTAGAQQGKAARDTTQHQLGRGAGRQGAQVGRAVFRGITLSDAQKEQVRAINTRYKDQRQSFRKDALADGSTSRPDSTEMAQLRQMNQKQQAELRGVLTPDQQAIFDKNIADARGKQGKRGRKGK